MEENGVSSNWISSALGIDCSQLVLCSRQHKLRWPWQAGQGSIFIRKDSCWNGLMCTSHRFFFSRTVLLEAQLCGWFDSVFQGIYRAMSCPRPMRISPSSASGHNCCTPDSRNYLLSWRSVIWSFRLIFLSDSRACTSDGTQWALHEWLQSLWPCSPTIMLPQSEQKNHRRIQVGGNLWRLSGLASCSWLLSWLLSLLCQSWRMMLRHLHKDLEILSGGKLSASLGHCPSPHCEENFSNSQLKFLLLLFVAFCAFVEGGCSCVSAHFC